MGKVEENDRKWKSKGKKKESKMKEVTLVGSSGPPAVTKGAPGNPCPMTDG